MDYDEFFILYFSFGIASDFVTKVLYFDIELEIKYFFNIMFSKKAKWYLYIFYLKIENLGRIVVKFKQVSKLFKGHMGEDINNLLILS